MSSLLETICTRLVPGLFLSRASIAASRGYHGEVLENLEKFETIKPLPVHYNIMKAVALYHLGKLEASVEKFSWSFNHINEIKRINKDTRMYLSTYIAYYLWYIDSTENIGEVSFEQKLEDYNFNIENVSSRYKHMFPFPDGMLTLR